MFPLSIELDSPTAQAGILLQGHKLCNSPQTLHIFLLGQTGSEIHPKMQRIQRQIRFRKMVRTNCIYLHVIRRRGGGGGRELLPYLTLPVRVAR